MSDHNTRQHAPMNVSPAITGPAPATQRRGAGVLPAQHALTGISVTPPVRIQAELTIGEPDDEFEREADEVADSVMSMAEPPTGKTPALQRVCTDCDAEEQLQALPLGAEPESPALQRLEVATSSSGGLVASGAAAARVAAARQGGVPLSSADRAFYQPRLAHDLSAVRVHSGPAADLAAASVGARAFTVGPDIVLGAGQPGPSTSAGRRLFAHELAHVVQQGHAPALGPEEES
jgi:hypothetical protein